MKSNFTYLNAIAWIMLFIYLFSAFNIFLPYISYSINRQYISKVLCVNKSRPKLNCNGKCYLTKELKKSAEKESQKNVDYVKVLEVESVPATATSIEFVCSHYIITQPILPFTASQYRSLSYCCDTPPPKA